MTAVATGLFIGGAAITVVGSIEHRLTLLLLGLACIGAAVLVAGSISP